MTKENNTFPTYEVRCINTKENSKAFGKTFTKEFESERDMKYFVNRCEHGKNVKVEAVIHNF